MTLVKTARMGQMFLSMRTQGTMRFPESDRYLHICLRDSVLTLILKEEFEE